MEDGDQIDAFVQQVKNTRNFVPFMLMYGDLAWWEVFVKHTIQSNFGLTLSGYYNYTNHFVATHTCHTLVVCRKDHSLNQLLKEYPRLLTSIPSCILKRFVHILNALFRALPSPAASNNFLNSSPLIQSSPCCNTFLALLVPPRASPIEACSVARTALRS